MLRTKREGEDASALRLPAATQPARRLSRSSFRSNQTRTKIPSIMPCFDLQRRLRHHGSFTGERQMCKHLSHLLSPGASSPFQKAPQCSGAGSGRLQMRVGVLLSRQNPASPLLRTPMLAQSRCLCLFKEHVTMSAAIAGRGPASGSPSHVPSRGVWTAEGLLQVYGYTTLLTML